MTDQDAILPRPEVQRRTSLPRTTMLDLIARGEFPKPIRLTPTGRRVGWLESEVNAWIASRIAESRTDSRATA